MSLNYSYKHDISYTNYNNKNLPWKVNTSYIYHNNQTINSSLKLGAIKNNLVIESSQNDIMLITPQNNKKVIAKNSVTINNNLDISNILKTNFINAKDLSLTGLLHTGNLTIIGNMDLLGTFTYQGGTSIGDISESETRFRGVNFVNNSMFYDVSIINTELFLSDFSNMNIFNSQIYNIPIGYTISNNSAPAKAVFSDVSLYTLVLDSSLNSKRYIKFSNSNSNSNSNIIIKSSDDYSKLEISKPLNLNVGFSFEQAVTNISNINVFHGDISCVKLYYSQLFPDVKLNNYFDVSIGQVSVSGNIIPNVNNRFNIGSSNYNFNEINSNQFIGDLSGRVPYAYNLRKNLDMSFNSLDIYGTFTLKGNNLNQFLSGELNSISKGTTDFSNVNKRVRDLSISLYSKADFDLCLNTNFAKISLHDASLLVQNNRITSISASVYSKSDFDLSLNRNLLRINDVSAITDVVTYPARIYPRLGYIDSSLIKQTNAKVSNELVFPYAITYVDDNVEDTNIKESYSYRKTTSQISEIYTTLNIINTTYNSSDVQVPVAGAQPNHINNTRVSMWFVNGATSPKLNSWMADDGTTLKPAVYINLMTVSPRVVLSYQVNWSSMTWEQHRLEAQQVRGRFLASILNSTEQTTVHNLIGTGSVWLGGRRRSDATSTDPNNSSFTNWEWVSGDGWSYTNFFQGAFNSEPSQFNQTALLIRAGGSDGGVWNDENSNLRYGAVYMTLQMNNFFEYQINTTPMTWAAHKLNAETVRHRYLATIENSNQNTLVAEYIANMSVSNQDYKRSVGSYIGGRRKAGSTNAYGITSTDWEWTNGTTWNNTNYFYLGGQTQTETIFTPNPSTTSQEAPVFISSTPYGTPQIDNFNVSNVKLPSLISSLDGSITVTATSIGALSLPPNPNDISSSTSTNSGTSTINQYRSEYTTTTTKIITNITYSLNSGLTTGSFKISDNTNNTSNYIARSSNTNISATYSCIAITDDGMFVALGNASEVTVYMRNSTNGWTTIGSSISVNFTAYTGTGVGIIPTQFTENWRKNLKNLAINFNYNTGSTTSQLLLAFGDTINIIKVYSYSNGTWSFSNGIYSVTGGSWGNNTLTSYSATTLGLSATTNFGYFVTLSQSPSVLGFTVDDRFYTYNCTTTNNTIRGSAKTLPINFSNATKNIVAFKMSSDADKIIVSNTHYVFIYKWINTDFSNINTISYLASAITFNYGSFTNISAAPRSLDISNISSINNDCVFAIGFPDVIIDVSNNKKSRGYVEYWKLVNNTLTRLITLLPRKRDFNNSSIDNDEYFFSAGGIKITNANTILVAPNFKFHFNSSNKKYELDAQNDTWTAHNTRATPSRFFASIQNEVENELVKISARNNSVWIGGKRVTNPINSEGAGGKTSRNWQWITPDTWIYQNFAINEPNNISEQGVQFTNSGWNDWTLSNSAQAIFMTLSTTYTLINSFTIFNNFFFHSSGFSSTYCRNNLSSTVIARWYSRTTSTPPTNSNTINFSADGRIVSNSKGVLTLSDIRLKENIVDTTPKLADLLKVRVVNYNLKGSDGKKLIGVIAQELEQLFPTLVNDGELSLYDINHGKTESYKSVKYSCFDIILIKAFQEQMAIINKLSSQLDEIEGKTKILKAISVSEDYIILNEELTLLKSENELFKLNINEILKLI